MAKRKQTIKSRMYEYFTEKPTGEFWMWAFIYLILFRYVGPLMITFVLFLMIGLDTPNVDIEPTIEQTTQNLAESFMLIGTKMFEVGQSIAINNPILSKVIFFLMGNMVYVIWAGMIWATFHIMRYFISWIIRRSTQTKEKEKVE